MIKTILFDMDGVLIDAKEWHYEALNDALKLFGMQISRTEHIAVYDGLPTRRKLEILTKSRGFPSKLHEFVNDVKQRRTLELTVERCRPMFHHQYALSRLRREGMRLAVCSNSIRQTVNAMMDASDLAQYLDFYLSNQDVARAKPEPDIYVEAIRRMRVEANEALIVEDNEHGIQSARASGAHVMEVGSVYDVTYDNIRQHIIQIERSAG